jgi:hypothetical protein
MFRHIKRFAKRAIRSALEPELQELPSQFHELRSREQTIQRVIVNQYTEAKQQSRTPYERISDAGFRAYSQFEEDGILLYLFSMLGFEGRTAVEICCGSGNECMAANLILNHGFAGYLFDGDKDNVDAATTFFNAQKDCLLNDPKIVKAWITAENVNDLLTSAGCPKNIDLLSLDIDGNDYWVLRAIDVISPRVMVLETHNVVPSNLSLTIPYRPDFDRRNGPHMDFAGASLLAVAKLCRDKGYRLIGAHRLGFNAFFLRNDQGSEQLFPEITVAEAHNNEFTRKAQATRWPAVSELPWVVV